MRGSYDYQLTLKDWSEDAFDIFDLTLGVIVIAAFFVLVGAFWQLLE